MKYLIFLAALIASPVCAQTYPPRTEQNTATLEGKPTDWKVIYNDGVTTLFEGPTGLTRSGKPYARFTSQFYRVEGRAFVPQFVLPGSAGGFTQTDIDRARAEGWAAGKAAAVAGAAAAR